MKKKLFALCAATAAALVLSVTAMADTSAVTITQSGTTSPCDWISGTNLVRREGANGYYISLLDGTALTEDSYESYFYFNKGFIEAGKNIEDYNNNGLLSKSGKTLVPCQYGAVKILGGHWAAGIRYRESDANNYDKEFSVSRNTIYGLIDKVDFYYIRNGVATVAGTLPRANYMDAAGHGDYVTIENRADGSFSLYDSTFHIVQSGLRSTSDTGNIETGSETYVKYSDNGQQGLKDAEGNVVLAPAYKYIEGISRGYVKVSTGEKYGVLDMSGNVLVPAQYDSIITNYNAPVPADDESYSSSSFVAGNYVCVTLNGKVGFVDLNGNVTMEPRYSKDILDVKGASALLTDLEGNVHILAADGVDTVLPDTYDRVSAMSYSNGYLYEVTNSDYDHGLIDWHGNELIPCSVDDVNLSADGTILLVEPDWNSSEYLIYDVSYNGGTETAATGTSAQTQDETSAETQTGTTETASADNSGIVNVLNSAIVLSGTDFAANQQAVRTLVSSAVSMLGSDQAAISSILQSAVTLIDSGAASGSAVTTLLQSVVSLLG